MNSWRLLQTDKEMLEDILSDEEYTVYLNEKTNFFQELWRKITDWLGSLIPGIKISETNSNILAYMLIAAGLFILIFLVYWLCKQIIKQKRLKRGLDFIEENLDQPFSFYLQKAEKCMGEQQHREAVRYAFIGYLVFLQSQQWLEIQSWKTNWEYWFELMDQKKAYADFFRGRALYFDSIWYGNKAVSNEDARRYIKEINKEISEVTSKP